jgi:hypothetical protein
MKKENTYANLKSDESTEFRKNVGFKNGDIFDLNSVMIEHQKGKYEALYPIFDKEKRRLLLNAGKTITKDTFERLRKEINDNLKKKRPSPYFFQEEKET